MKRLSIRGMIAAVLLPGGCGLTAGRGATEPLWGSMGLADETQGSPALRGTTLGFATERRWRSQCLAAVIRANRRTSRLQATPVLLVVSERAPLPRRA